MSDPEKPPTDSPSSGPAGAKPSPAANVISIEQARAELLRRPRKGATPPRGLEGAVRSRGRAVPTPVTMPPGEHSAVIVTDTPAARAHIDKKTVHPGEAPGQTHEKKVRVKTHLDPRRAKTQLTDRRTPEPPAVQSFPGESPDEGSLWNRPSQAPPESAAAQGQRPSLVRAPPMSRDRKQSSPLFVIGIMLAATIGAVVVFMLGRTKADPGRGKPVAADTAVTAGTLPPAAPTTAAADTTAPATPSSVPVATAATTPEPVASSAPAQANGGAPAVKTATSAPATKPSTAPATSVNATAKPTATAVLPFGKEEP